jgi:hypothetical protein
MKTNHIIQTSLMAIMILLPAGLARSKEAEYKGKAISEWLVGLHADITDVEFIAARNQNVDPAKFRDQKQGQAQDAIRQIGTNGLPVLLDLLSAGEGRQWIMSRRIQSKEIKSLLRDGNPDSREAVRGMAVDGFAILGTNAELALPALNKLLHGDPHCQLEVTKAMLRVGPKGFTVLTNILNDPVDPTRNTLIWVIGEEGGNDKTVTALLVQALKDADYSNRGNAARFLKGRDPELAIPVLIPMLDEYKYPDDTYTMDGVVHALESYGLAASNAVPKLYSLFTNAVVGTNWHAAMGTGKIIMAALKAIDLKAAGQAEEFLVNSGPLNYARDGYSRTKLTNGLELIAGGYVHTEIPARSNRCLSSAELLNPKTRKWTETGKMNVARYDHKATLLPDGTVLVVGGSDIKNDAVTNKEIYDPTTGIWCVATNK